MYYIAQRPTAAVKQEFITEAKRFPDSAQLESWPQGTLDCFTVVAVFRIGPIIKTGDHTGSHYG